MDDLKPGDVTIEECIIHSYDDARRYDLKAQTRMIDVYESALEPVVYAEFIIHDAIGLLRGFPLIGEEYITLKFRTPGRDLIEFTLYVTSIDDVQPVLNNKAVVYTIKAVSEEMLMKNASRRVARKVEGQISSSVKSILSDELGINKPIEVEATRGIDSYLISNLTPLEAIEMLRVRATSATNTSSSYVFFETRKGYYFITLEGMIRKAQQQGPSIVFDYDENIDVDITQSRFRDIIAYERKERDNTIERTRRGALKNRVQKFDLLTGELKHLEFESEDYEELFARTGAEARRSTSKFNDNFGTAPGMVTTVAATSEDEENFIADKKGVLSAFLERVVDNLMSVYIFGDSSIDIGEIITCNVILGSGLTSGVDKRVESTNNMVLQIRHMIEVADRPMYTQSLEVLNNSYS